MAATWLVVRAEIRRRWRSWLVLAALVAVAGGFVLAATAAGRRTASAFPRYLERYGYDDITYSLKPLPGIAKLPEVTSVVSITSPASGDPTCDCPRLHSQNLSVDEVAPVDIGRYVKLVSGRPPDQSDPREVLASFTLAGQHGLGVGSVITVPFASPSQEALANGTSNEAPTGPTVAFRIVGLVAAQGDFPSVGTPSYSLYATAAFARTYNQRTILYHGYAVRLRHGAADQPRFERDAASLGAIGFGGSQSAPALVAAVHPQAEGWWILAFLAGLGGLAAVGQALGRQAAVEQSTYRTLAALGLRRRQIVLSGLARALGIGVVGAAGAIVLAYASSPLTPVGEARSAEPSTGLAFDPLVLGAGGAAVVILVLLLGLRPALRAAAPAGATREPGDRPSRLLSGLIGAGAPPTVVIGVRRALERGHGRNAVPVGNALAGVTVAVAALSGTAVFGASLSNLTATPSLYGQPFQMWFNNTGQGPAGAVNLVSRLQADPAITAITLGTSAAVTIDGRGTPAIAGQPLRGPMLVSSVSGRVPTGPDEVALGQKTLTELGAHVGSVVKVRVAVASGGQRTSPFRVVGVASFPPDFGVVGLNTGAVFTVDGLLDAGCAPGPARAGCEAAARSSFNFVVLTSIRPAVAVGTLARYQRLYPDTITLPVTPANLVSFGTAVDFPLILGVIVVLFGTASLVHVLVVSVARRRREQAVLKTLGFVRGQIVGSVCLQATTVALIGAVFGVPLGVAGGRWIWRAFATNIGVVPVDIVHASTMALIAAGVLAAANALAVGPALVSSGVPPAPALRSE